MHPIATAEKNDVYRGAAQKGGDDIWRRISGGRGCGKIDSELGVPEVMFCGGFGVSERCLRGRCEGGRGDAPHECHT